MSSRSAATTACAASRLRKQKNLLGIVAKAREQNPELKIFLAGMQMPDNMGPDFTARFQAIFPEAAKESQATLIPFLLEDIGGIEKLNQSDGIHPTPEGQAKVAATVWKIIQPALTKWATMPVYCRDKGRD